MLIIIILSSQLDLTGAFPLTRCVSRTKALSLSPKEIPHRVLLRRSNSHRSNEKNGGGCPDHSGFSAATAIISCAALALTGTAGVFWSEVSIFQTGCGPLAMPDWLERSCYLDVLFVSGWSVFLRIVFAGTRIADLVLTNREETLWSKQLIQFAEYAAFLAVLGAVLALGNQMINGERMDGLSGIDLERCRARQIFELESMH